MRCCTSAKRFKPMSLAPSRSCLPLEETVTLYDLTNTYMEGQAQSNAKASHGRSKEKRTDCPLVTLGLVLDGSGGRKSQRSCAPLPNCQSGPGG